jgi:hypothetical protein
MRLFMPHPKGTHATRLSHRLASEEVMGHSEMDSKYQSLHNTHDRAPVKPKEIDSVDHHFSGTPAHAKTPDPRADLDRSETANYPGQQEQE